MSRVVTERMKGYTVGLVVGAVCTHLGYLLVWGLA